MLGYKTDDSLCTSALVCGMPVVARILLFTRMTQTAMWNV
jgi:hypothetical protein